MVKLAWHPCTGCGKASNTRNSTPLCHECRAKRREQKQQQKHGPACKHCGEQCRSETQTYCTLTCWYAALSIIKCKDDAPCAVEGCTNAGPRTQGYCRTHYNRIIRGYPNSENTCELCSSTFRTSKDDTLCRRCSTTASINVINCALCDKLITTRTAKQRYCSTHTVSERTSHRITQRYSSDTAYRDKIITRAQARRADKLTINGDNTNKRELITYLMTRDKARCGICCTPIKATKGPNKPSIDHIVPISKGGTHTLENLQITHYRCNLSKGNKGHGEQLALIG